MVRASLRGLLLLILGGAVLQAQAAPPEAEKKEPDPYVQVGQITARVIGVEESTRNLRLKIETKQINPSAVQAIAQAQYNLARARSPYDRLRAQQNLLQQQRNLYRTVSQDISLETLEEVKVRVANPPPTFDEKGNLVRPTAEKLKELKGPDPRLPGYSAEFTDVRVDQIVQVTLVKRRDAMRGRPVPRGKDVDVELLMKENAPKVSMIVVVADIAMGK